MLYPSAYIDYLIEFHGTRDYFECHEIMEEYWKSKRDDPFAPTWVGLIQVAVSLYHHRRGNIAGAVKMNRQALSNLVLDQLQQLGMNGEQFIAMLEQRLDRLSQGHDEFQDINLPLVDQALIAECEQLCSAKGHIWRRTSPMADDALLHRHTLRDRSGVIQARLEQLRKKSRQA